MFVTDDDVKLKKELFRTRYTSFHDISPAFTISAGI